MAISDIPSFGYILLVTEYQLRNPIRDVKLGLGAGPDAARGYKSPHTQSSVRWEPVALMVAGGWALGALLI